MTMARNSSANLSDDVWPPGFRFHPTDEELLLYYLKRKIYGRKLKLDVIAVVDVYKQEPEELPGLSLLKNGDRQWFYFSPRDRKYPNGSRSNRATRHGYWKATGKDRTITCNGRNVGIKKTLVFYRGRAPSGERTDWVMHEYTLLDEELQRCDKDKEYYAIYKLFRKSGPGPKNGEQYGAPFREEDWVDDELEITANSNQAIQIHQIHQANHISATIYAQVDPQLSDIRVTNHVLPQAASQPQPAAVDDFDLALSQFIGEEENHSTMVHGSDGEAVYAEENGWANSFNVAQTDNSGLQTWDMPEVNSDARNFELPPVVEEDFLEMDDLLGPEPVQGVQNSEFGEVNGLSEFDLYYDAGAFLHDLGSTNEAVAPEASFQLQPFSDPVSGFADELWTYDTNNFLPTITEQSGVVSAGGMSASINAESNQNQGGEEAQTWLSSALWSFVESIPAAPASAADSALVNKAFQRMSSFGRLNVRLNAKTTTIAAASAGSVSSRSDASAGVVGGRSMKGFLFLSFLAALFAVLCVFINSNASVFGKLHCRMKL